MRRDPARAQPGGGLPGFAADLRAQAVVDDQAADRAAPRRRPASASRQSARLSGPPETATASRGRRSNGPSAAISAAKLGRVRAGAAGRSDALGARALAGQRLLDVGRRVRELLGELGVGQAGLVVLAQAFERHAELQQVVRRLGRVLP